MAERKAIFSEINITPLTDIFLVLLIIMMVVAPSFQSVDNSINVPEINSGVSIEQKKATVSITAGGEFYLNGEKIQPDDLYSALETLKPDLEKKDVVVKADASIKSNMVMQVMRAAEAAGYEKLTIAGEPLSKKDAKMLEENQNEEYTQEEQPQQQNETSYEDRQKVGAIPGD